MEWTSAEGEFLDIRLTGDCDLYAAPGFAAYMLERITQGARRMRIDFSAVDYLDSTGVGAIIHIVQASRKANVDVRFVGISGNPRKVLRMTNILPLLREEGARAELR
jgi:anti-sigma B factor antagonist